MQCLGIAAAGCAIAVVASASFVRMCKARLAMVCAIGVSMGMVLAGVEAWCVMSARDQFEAFPGTAVVRLVEDSSAASYGERALAVVEGMGAHGLAAVYLPGEEAHYQGDRLRIEASAKPADFAGDSYAWSRASCAALYARSCESLDDDSPEALIRAVRRKAIEGFGAESAEARLLGAIVCGYRHGVAATSEYASFQACGLAHLVAVSGAHLVIVTGIVVSALRAVGARRGTVVFAALSVMLAYLVFAGMPRSAIRASVMSCLGLASFYGRRRPSSLNALGVGVCLMVGASPHDAVSVSFALSCLSTAGIVMFAPLFEHQLERALPTWPPAVVGPLSLTLAASMLSQLFAASVFGVLPLVAPISNVVCAPLFPLACGSGLVSAAWSQVGLPFSEVPLGFATGAAWLLDEAAGLLARVPLACIPCGIGSFEALAVSLCCAAACWIAWMRIDAKTACAIFAATVLATGAYGLAIARADAIIALDVGQGDAFLLRSRGETLLVDTGNHDSMLVSALGKVHVSRLDSVLITHADDDHCGSLDALERFVAVDRVIVAREMLTCGDESCRALVEQAQRTADEAIGVSAGDVFKVGAFTCEVVWPHAFEENGGNADSLCLLVSYDGDDDGSVDATALFTGDAESSELASIIEEQHLGNVDILKVGHHGSRNGMTEEEVRLLDPTIALIGVGANNRYGHPSPEIVEMLENAGCSVFRTDVDGNVTCALEPDGVSVRTRS